MLTHCPCAPACTIAVDLTLRSSESILIGTHSAMLANGTGGFPLVGMVEAADEPIDCTEAAGTLKTLLKLLHEHDLSATESLQDLTANEVIKVGHAANKYGAREIADRCIVVVRSKAKDIPWPAMLYGLRYNDVIAMDLAAPHTLALNGRTELEALDDMAARAWYLTLISSILTTPPVYINRKHQEHNCGGWGTYVDNVVGHVSSVPLDTLIYDVAVNGSRVVFPLRNWTDSRPVNPGYGGTCQTCKKRAKAWTRKAEAAVSMEGQKSISQVLQGLTK
ncbi:hypothetical protein FA13DRAFT_708704 [Coprinellus micaceus]|uniref:BTB domain-containing protein n=1 Tax=Coprinellus micaceus TaxID=71717 RepID=A0A4Y7TUI3_COPMI|nr:hypothetical protein FA13DRAFT_708704 [Coprinellus micaceus]